MEWKTTIILNSEHHVTRNVFRSDWNLVPLPVWGVSQSCWTWLCGLPLCPPHSCHRLHRSGCWQSCSGNWHWLTYWVWIGCSPRCLLSPSYPCCVLAPRNNTYIKATRLPKMLCYNIGTKYNIPKLEIREIGQTGMQAGRNSHMTDLLFILCFRCGAIVGFLKQDLLHFTILQIVKLSHCVLSPTYQVYENWFWSLTLDKCMLEVEHRK